MHRLMDVSCSNCNKFSHCNNNNLICISKYEAKEQECEKLNSDNRYFVNKIISLELLTDEYEQALNEIEQYRVAEINDEDEAENDTILTIINEVKENTGDR